MSSSEEVHKGCQLAEFPVKRGKQAAIVDEAEKLGEGLFREDAPCLLSWLQEKGVTMLAGVNYKRITDEGLIVTTKEGETRSLEADSTLTALPLMPNSDLLRTLKGCVQEVYEIGDCKQAGFMHDAIGDGSSVGRMI